MTATVDEAYQNWLEDQSPQNMAGVVSALDPMITAEINRYSGPNSLLKPKAKSLAIGAVRTYDPGRGAQLTSWVNTNLRPLTRYSSQDLAQVHVGENRRRQAAEMNRMTEELALELGDVPTDDQLSDRMGVSIKKIKKIRDSVLPVAADAAFESAGHNAADTAVDDADSDRQTSAAEMVYASLDARDKIIYDLRIGAHGQQSVDAQSVARRLGVSPAYVSQRAAAIAQQIQDTTSRV